MLAAPTVSPACRFEAEIGWPLTDMEREMSSKPTLAEMTYLVHVEATEESDRRLDAIVQFARSTNAALRGVGGCEPVSRANPWIATSYQVGSVIEVLAEFEAADLKQAETRFRAAAACLGGDASWEADHQYPDSSLPIRSAGADVIVTGIRRGPEATTAAAADLVMRAGVPVLAMPDYVGSISAKRIVVAWKNTREARRALTDALPFLSAADEVTITAAAEDDKESDDGLDAAIGRLKRHGIAAQGQRLGKSEREPVEAFLLAAEDAMADLIVAGAYGRSRLREWVLGGFTQGLLTQSRRPMLLSH